MSGANVGLCDFQISVCASGVSNVGWNGKYARYCGTLLSMMNR